MESSFSLSLLIKIGQEIHIDELQKKGLIFSKTVKYYRELEHENDLLRRDTTEGAVSSSDVDILKILINDKVIPIKFEKARLRQFNNDLDLTHIFCLYAATLEHIDSEPFINERIHKFGDTALLITDPGEFVRRVERAIKNRFRYKFTPVKYYKEDKDCTNLTVFDKHEDYLFQREFRFHFDHIDENDLLFEIGSIEDISMKVKSEDLLKLTIRTLLPS